MQKCKGINHKARGGKRLNRHPVIHKPKRRIRGGDDWQERDPNRDKSFEIYKEHKGKIDLVEIASRLNLPSGTIRGWKSKDEWEQKLNGTLQLNTERSKRAKGGQPGNKKCYWTTSE